METTTATNIPTYTPPEQFKAVGKKDLDRNDFMSLFITQLQFQDPTKPMDSYQVASQLAQFSSLEATMKVSANMEKLLEYQVSQNNLQLLTLLNENVQTKGNWMTATGGAVKPTEFYLDAPAARCTVRIFNENGEYLRKIDLGASEAGLHPLEWDGKDDAGRTVPDGFYTYKVEATDLLGEEVKLTPYATGRVSNLAFDKGNAALTLEDRVAVKASDIVKVVAKRANSGGATAVAE